MQGARLRWRCCSSQTRKRRSGSFQKVAGSRMSQRCRLRRARHMRRLASWERWATCWPTTNTPARAASSATATLHSRSPTPWTSGQSLTTGSENGSPSFRHHSSASGRACTTPSWPSSQNWSKIKQRSQRNRQELHKAHNQHTSPVLPLHLNQQQQRQEQQQQHHLQLQPLPLLPPPPLIPQPTLQKRHHNWPPTLLATLHTKHIHSHSRLGLWLLAPCLIHLLVVLPFPPPFFFPPFPLLPLLHFSPPVPLFFFVFCSFVCLFACYCIAFYFLGCLWVMSLRALAKSHNLLFVFCVLLFCFFLGVCGEDRTAG